MSVPGGYRRARNRIRTLASSRSPCKGRCQACTLRGVLVEDVNSLHCFALVTSYCADSPGFAFADPVALLGNFSRLETF